MNLSEVRLLECNMVVVFRELRFTQVLNELARRLLPEHNSPLITEIPGQLLAVVYPDRRIECQFANRRVHVADKRGLAPGESPFGVIAVNAMEAASQASSGEQGIVAYGYNYVMHVKESNATHYIAARFFRDADSISRAFSGELQGIGFVAGVNVAQRNCLASVSLKPVPNVPDLIEATANYHYEGQHPPKSAQEISERVASQYSEFQRALSQF